MSEESATTATSMRAVGHAGICDAMAHIDNRYPDTMTFSFSSSFAKPKEMCQILVSG
jgi:hypothetical protein